MTPKPVRFFRRAVLTFYFLLLAALLWLHGPAATSWSRLIVLGVIVLPLLTPMRGLLEGSLYTHRWTTLLVIAYLAYGLVEVVANPAARHAAIAILFASFLLFSSLLGYIRAVTWPRS